MTYTTADARRQLLEAVAEATDEIGLALAAIGEAYELLDENSADELERELFRPVQGAYGRAKRTHSEFAERHALPGQTFESPIPGAPSKGVKGFLEDAVQAIARADGTLSGLQDSMLPIEVGDPELRAGLEDVRMLIGDVQAKVRQLTRTLGR
jgi:hypothetical protein